MIIIKESRDLKRILQNQKGRFSLGFVPTMGALHEGHLSLIQIARSRNSLLIASIFVNPTQFNDPDDYEKYPKTLENDINMLENAGCDFLFIPEIKEMYPNGIDIQHHYELGEIEKKLEGVFRPGHFQGVCTIVDKLFELIGPDDVYFGQKDYQQCLIIKKMILLKSHKCRLHICPIIREKNGLAMSSRNRRLDEMQKAKASGIYQILEEIKEHIQPGSTISLKEYFTKKLNENGFQTEYLEFAEPETLDTVASWDGLQKIIVLVAAFLGEIRLIDNMVLSESN